jgi:hypothetical protein
MDQMATGDAPEARMSIIACLAAAACWGVLMVLKIAFAELKETKLMPREHTRSFAAQIGHILAQPEAAGSVLII